MKIEYRSVERLPQGPLLCVSHSDRPVDLQRCSLNFLERRYAAPDRLPAKVPFSSLGPAKDSNPFRGDVTVWELTGDVSADPKPRLLLHLRPTNHGDKPQQAVWWRGKLWVCFTERMDVLDAGGRKIAEFSDPWFAGGHTAMPDGRGRMLLSASASDSVLIVDAESLSVVDAWRLPESLYGRNFDLSRFDDCRRHFINNDLQTTHVNCAAPCGDGVIASSLIPGAIGVFDASGAYREVMHGFVGCHGVRPSPAGGFYFCDSCLGTVVSAESDGRMTGRYDAGSSWLHDAQHVGGDVYALAVADRNTVEFVDLKSGKTLATISGEGFGRSTQFLWHGC